MLASFSLSSADGSVSLCTYCTVPFAGDELTDGVCFDSPISSGYFKAPIS